MTNKSPTVPVKTPRKSAKSSTPAAPKAGRRRGRLDEQKLLRVAAHLFRTRGFRGATLREIAKAADMHPGSVHYRYPTKDALLLALMEKAVEIGTSSVRKAVDSTPHPEMRLHQAIRAHVQLLLEGNDDTVYVLLHDWRTLDGEARGRMIELRDRYDRLWDSLILDAVGEGHIRPGVDLKMLRLLGFGAVNWAAQWYRPDGGLTPTEIADTFWAFLTFGVSTEDARPPDVNGIFARLRQKTTRDAPADGATEAS